MTFIYIAKVPDRAFRRDGEVVQGTPDVSNGIASLNRCGEHRLYQRGQAHAADQHGSCRFVAVSEPERGHDCRNSVGVLQSHNRSASPTKTIMRIPPLSCNRHRFEATVPMANALGEPLLRSSISGADGKAAAGDA